MVTLIANIVCNDLVADKIRVALLVYSTLTYRGICLCFILIIPPVFKRN